MSLCSVTGAGQNGAAAEQASAGTLPCVRAYTHSAIPRARKSDGQSQTLLTSAFSCIFFLRFSLAQSISDLEARVEDDEENEDECTRLEQELRIVTSRLVQANVALAQAKEDAADAERKKVSQLGYLCAGAVQKEAVSFVGSLV